MDRYPGARTSDEWVRAVEENLGVGFWSWDTASLRLASSAGLYRLVGLNPSAVRMDLSFMETLIHPADRLHLEDSNRLALDSRQADRQFRIIRPDGQMRWLHSQASSFRDRDGEVTRIVAVVSDITKQREVMGRLSSKRALLHNVSTLVDGALWISDEDGQLLEVFEGGDSSSRQEAAPISSSWRSNLHPEDEKRLPDVWRQAVEHKKPYYFAPRLKGRDGQYRSLQVAGLPFSLQHSPERHWGGLCIAGAMVLPTHANGQAEEPLLAPAQVRACRALLDWSAEMLAHNAGISVSTVRRMESADAPYGQSDSLRLVILAFRRAGLKIWRGEDGRLCVADT